MRSSTYGRTRDVVTRCQPEFLFYYFGDSWASGKTARTLPDFRGKRAQIRRPCRVRPNTYSSWPHNSAKNTNGKRTPVLSSIRLPRSQSVAPENRSLSISIRGQNDRALFTGLLCSKQKYYVHMHIFFYNLFF